MLACFRVRVRARVREREGPLELSPVQASLEQGWHDSLLVDDAGFEMIS
jgi:hypothetical protein